MASPEQTSPEVYEPTKEKFAALAEYAFSLGCNLDINDILTSQLYLQRVEYYRHLQEEQTDNQLLNGVISSGVRNVGYHLTNVVRDSCDAETATAPLDETHPSPEETALIEILGIEILETGKQALPPEAKDLAKKWGWASKFERIDIIYELYKVISNKYYFVDEVTNRQHDEDGRIIYQAEDALPMHNKQHHPNCLGLSILLAAWAELAGADYLYTSTIQHRYRHIWQWHANSMLHLKDFLETQNLTYNQSVWDSIHLDTKTGTEISGQINDFHHAIAIKIGEGHWLHFDPYQSSLAVFSEKRWQMEKINKYLKDASQYMPGLTLLQSDAIDLRKGFKNQEEYFERSLELSALLQARIEKEDPITHDHLFTLLKDFMNQDLPEWAQSNNLPKKNIKHMDHLGSWIGNTSLCSVERRKVPTRKGSHSRKKRPLTIIESKMLKRFDQDSGFRQRVLADIILKPVYIATSLECEDVSVLTDICSMPEISLEFARPDFMIGLLTLNHLQAWSNYGNNSTSSRLVEHSSSQIFWHEALQYDQPSMTPAMAQMTELLSKLDGDLLHDRCKLALASLGIDRNDDF